MSGWRKVLAKVARRAEREGRNLKVFLNDMSDLFDDHDGDVVDQEKHRLWINGDRVVSEAGDFTGTVWRAEGFEPLRISHLRQQVFAEVDRYADRLTFLMLTKRPGNVRRMWPQEYCDGYGNRRADGDYFGVCHRHNVWLLCSASDQETFDPAYLPMMNIRDLVPVWGFSLEPLLGPIDMRLLNMGKKFLPSWVIVGGESGPRHRPMELAWLESIAEQCVDAGVPLFVKQDCGQKAAQQGRIPDENWAMKQFPKGAK